MTNKKLNKKINKLRKKKANIHKDIIDSYSQLMTMYENRLMSNAIYRNSKPLSSLNEFLSDMEIEEMLYDLKHR